MARNVLNKDLIREIKNTRARFMSIFLLVTLSVAFLSGLRTTEPDMTKSADDYLDSTNLMDIRIVSTLGLTDDDLVALSELEGVSGAEGDWLVDAMVTNGEVSLVVKTISYTEGGMNQPYLLEGRLPEAEDECVVEQDLLDSLELSIGDSVTFDTGTGDYEGALTRNTFTVVGTCSSPLYISMQKGTSSLGSGSISAIVYLPRTAYGLDYYTDIYLTLEGALELNAYSDAYTALVDAFTATIEDFALERADIRTEVIRRDAQQQLDDAQAEYDQAKAEAETQLEEAETELADARTQLDDGWTEYEEGLETLESETASGQSQISSAQSQLAQAYTTLTEGEAEYEAGVQALAEAQEQYEAGLAAYEAALAEYEEGYQEYQQAVAAYEAMVSAYEAILSAYSASDTQWESMLDVLEEYQVDEAVIASLLEQRQEQIAALAAAVQSLSSDLGLTDQDITQIVAQLQAGEISQDDITELLNTTGQTLAETATTLAEAKQQLDQAKATLDAAAESIAQGQTELEEARSQLDQGWEDYYSGKTSVSTAQKQLTTSVTQAQQQLDEALETLTQGEADYADGLEEYQDARAEAETQLAEALELIEEGQEEIDSISDCTWYVLDRSSNLGFAGYQSDAENMGNLAAVFPLIFFLVAALVCLTTMTRMVEEQRVTIGGLKAMGYSRGAIARKYVGYGLIASLGGSVLGLLLGCTLIPWIIITCWQIMYSIPEVKFSFQPLTYVLSAGAAVLVIVGTVLSATLATLRATPATLMRQKTPKAGKRVLLEHIPFVWRRLTFTQKVTVRNLFRYKKRFWMTIIGISGCTALIVTGFGLRDSIDNVLNIQYDQLNLYDATAVMVEENESELVSMLEADSLVQGYAVVHQGSVDFEGLNTISGYYMVYDDAESITEFMVFRDRVSGAAVELTDDGIYIGEKLSELMGLSVGDTVILSGDQRVKATVAGIVENHVNNYAYMTQACYESLYGQTAEHNVALISYTEDSESAEDAVGSALLDAGVITSITQISAMRESLNSSFEVINYAVLIVIVSAAALAFVVLFNLSNINITERKRELATLKVLGFNDREMSDYVLRENIILTILGILLGLLLGKWLHGFLVKSVEVEMIMFAREAEPLSYLLAALLTVLFAAIVNIIASHALKKIDMVESLKSVE